MDHGNLRKYLAFIKEKGNQLKEKEGNKQNLRTKGLVEIHSLEYLIELEYTLAKNNKYGRWSGIEICEGKAAWTHWDKAVLKLSWQQ